MHTEPGCRHRPRACNGRPGSPSSFDAWPHAPRRPAQRRPGHWYLGTQGCLGPLLGWTPQTRGANLPQGRRTPRHAGPGARAPGGGACAASASRCASSWYRPASSRCSAARNARRMAPSPPPAPPTPAAPPPCAWPRTRLRAVRAAARLSRAASRHCRAPRRAPWPPAWLPQVAGAESVARCPSDALARGCALHHG